MKPRMHPATEDAEELVTQIIGIVEEQNSISDAGGDRQILKTPEITPTNVHFRNIVTSCPNTLGDSSKVDCDAIGPDGR
jgi:hypothetical protein